MSLIRFSKLFAILGPFLMVGVSYAQTYERVTSPTSCPPEGRTCFTSPDAGPDGGACKPGKPIPPGGLGGVCKTIRTPMCCLVGDIGAPPSPPRGGGVVTAGSGDLICPPENGCSFLERGSSMAVGQSCIIGDPKKRTKRLCPADMMGLWCCPTRK